MAFTVTAKAIVPKGFDTRKLRVEVGRALIDEGKRDRKEMEKTTGHRTWSKAPPMGYLTGITLKSAWVWIGPIGNDELIEKWRRLDEGTKPHPIAARRAPSLAFPFQGKGKSYNPKTRPLWFGSRSSAGQKFGPIIKPKMVNHPGNEPRYWSKTLAARRIKPFAHNVQAAINRGLA